MVVISEEDFKFDWPSYAGRLLAMKIVKALKRNFFKKDFHHKKRVVTASGKFVTTH